MIRACPSCHKPNRIPAKHLASTGRCGACKGVLAPVGEPIDADAATFDEIIESAGVPVLVDFWAGWCGPCRTAAPEVKRAAHEVAGRALVLKVDTERHPEVAARYGVRSIPNFVVFKSGQVVRQQAGVVPHAQLVAWLARAA